MAIIGELDSIKNRFFGRNKNLLDQVFDYLGAAVDESSLINKRIFSRPLGAFERVDISNGVFALEQVFETKDRKECFYESHLKYIDFQLNLSGVEQMEYVFSNRMSVKTSYDEKRDLIIYHDTSYASKVIMQAGDIAIYFPEDVHMGLPWFDGKKSKVYKTVVKLPLSLYYDVLK